MTDTVYTIQFVHHHPVLETDRFLEEIQTALHFLTSVPANVFRCTYNTMPILIGIFLHHVERCCL